MNLNPDNEQLAAAAFSLQSTVFDELYGSNSIIRYKRERVRKHVLQWIGKNSEILELNSGTGEDAIWFAQQGHRVHATDIAAGMQEQLVKKAAAAGLDDLVSTEIISYTALQHLKEKKQYDLVFSNFAGLNCTAELDTVLQALVPIVKPGGIVTLVILPRFCLWETLLLFKGKFRTAFRRFFSNKGRQARVEGEYFTCWYYDPAFVKKHMKEDFDLVAQEGLCSIVPPSYIGHFAEKHPGLFSFLKAKEERWKNSWPWKNTGDYYIISFRKKKLAK